MKWKLLFCAAVLAAAGCASESPDPYTNYENFGFRNDLIPSPLEGMMIAEIDVASDAGAIPPAKIHNQSP